MDIVEACPYIDFKDSAFIGSSLSGDELVLYLNSWDEKEIKIIFKNPIYFIYKTGDVIDGIYEKKNCLSELNTILSGYYEQVFGVTGKFPKQHLFRLFVMRDIYDRPIFEIVAESITASKNPQLRTS